MANGLAADWQGRLIACELATSRVTRTGPDGAPADLRAPVRAESGCLAITAAAFGDANKVLDAL